MKKIILAISFLSLTCVATIAQNTQRRPPVDRKPAIKQVDVTAQTVKRQPAGKAYSLDLNRKGTIYNLASGVDLSRVRVRATKADMTTVDMTVAELIQKSGKNITGPIRVGMTSDIRAQRLAGGRRPGGIGGRGLNYDCSDLACACTGEDDCIDMFDSDKCGLIAVCYPDGCICIRI